MIRNVSKPQNSCRRGKRQRQDHSSLTCDPGRWVNLMKSEAFGSSYGHQIPERWGSWDRCGTWALDPSKAGFSRDTLMKALKAEGVSISMWDYPEQHKLKI